MLTLKELRFKKTGLNQKEMAAMLGVTPGALCHYEKGIRQPDLRTMKKMASILGVDMQVLVNIFLHEDVQEREKSAV